MPEPTQLAFDGREAPVTGPVAALRGGQREILLWIRDHGTIRTGQAGIIVHAHRASPCAGRDQADVETARPCCGWASSDGWQALERLRGRGLVVAVARGVWESVAAPAPTGDLVTDLGRAQARLRARAAPRPEES